VGGLEGAVDIEVVLMWQIDRLCVSVAGGDESNFLQLSLPGEKEREREREREKWRDRRASPLASPC